jgi:hypothetical protein
MNDQKDTNPKRPTLQIRAGKPAVKPEDASAPVESAPATDATPAAAALALAAASAQPAHPSPAAEEASSSPAREAEVARPGRSWRRPGAQAAVLAVAVGLGWFGGAGLVSGSRSSQAALTQWTETSASIRQSQEDVVRLTGDVRALKVAIDALKDGIERVRGETVSKQSQLLERLDRLDRTAQDSASKASRVAEQLERLASADRDPAKIAPLMDRLERAEKQANAVASNPKPAAAPAAPSEPAQTGSIDAKPQAKQAVLEGWVLRDIYDGVALVEGPNHRLHEVAPGQAVAAIGRVEAIERRGKAWVVVTSKGVIGAERWQ